VREMAILYSIGRRIDRLVEMSEEPVRPGGLNLQIVGNPDSRTKELAHLLTKW
jgi:hypothetical protein